MSTDMRVIIACAAIIAITILVCYIAKIYGEYIDKWRKEE